MNTQRACIAGVLGIALCTGCRTPTDYRGSAVFVALGQKPLFTEVSKPYSIHQLGIGASECAGGDSRTSWFELRSRFSVSSGSRDALFTAYRDAVQQEVVSRAAHAWGGEIISENDLRRFAIDYMAGTHEGTVYAYSLISTNDEMSLVSFVYEHAR